MPSLEAGAKDTERGSGGLPEVGDGSVVRPAEAAVLVDLSASGNSAQALQVLEDALRTRIRPGAGQRIDLNAGNLLLTQKVLAKMGHLLQSWGVQLHTVYARLPQTQQAALDAGFFVKEVPPAPSLAPRALSGRTFLASVSPEAPPEVPREIPLAAKEVSSVELPFSPRGAEAASASPAASDTRDVARRPFKAVQTVVQGFIRGRTESAPQAVPAGEAVGALRELSPEGPAAPAANTPRPSGETLYLKQTVRSGRVVRFDGNIVVIGDVHEGSELLAGGDIAVWGELRGIAHAGMAGSAKAEIRAMRINAIQLRIGDFIARRPDRIFYHKDADGGDVVAPELARVADGEIKIFKEVMA